MTDWTKESKAYERAFARSFEATKRTVPQSMVPEGTHGPWTVKKFTLKESEVAMPLARAVIRVPRGKKKHVTLPQVNLP